MVESIQSSNTNGANVSYTYDGLNRLSTVVDNRLPSNNTTTYTYDNASNVATVAYPNGLTSTFTYDELNRVTNLATPPIANYSYTLGLTGNRTNATEQSGRTLQWTYNGIYQLAAKPFIPRAIAQQINPDKKPIINDLRRNPVPNQCVFKKSVKFSATQTLEMFNLKQPKPPPQVVPMVRVAKNHNLLIEHFACFVTT